MASLSMSLAAKTVRSSLRTIRIKYVCRLGRSFLGHCVTHQHVLAKVRLDDLENCRVFVGASSESVWMRNCKNCKVNNVVALLFVQ